VKKDCTEAGANGGLGRLKFGGKGARAQEKNKEMQLEGTSMTPEKKSGEAVGEKKKGHHETKAKGGNKSKVG